MSVTLMLGKTIYKWLLKIQIMKDRQFHVNGGAELHLNCG